MRSVSSYICCCSHTIKLLLTKKLVHTVNISLDVQGKLTSKIFGPYCLKVISNISSYGLAPVYKIRVKSCLFPIWPSYSVKEFRTLRQASINVNKTLTVNFTSVFRKCFERLFEIPLANRTIVISLPARSKHQSYLQSPMLQSQSH